MMRVTSRLALFSMFLALATPVVASAATDASAKASARAAVKHQELASSSAMVFDMKATKIIYSSNPDQVVPIASISKLMTAMVILDAKQPMDEVIDVDISSNPHMKGVFSRVRLHSQVTRRQMLLMALMSSENRAANSLAEHYPGGYDAFIKAMNAKAKYIGMTRTHFVEPTGLSYDNVSTARDLTRMLLVTRKYPMLSELSTTKEKSITFTNPSYTLPFRNTNHLLYGKKDWSIQLTKTGFNDEAGHCLAMRTTINGHPMTLVVLDAYGKQTHFADATRLRNWLETGKVSPLPASARDYRKQRDQERASLTKADEEG